MFRTKHRRRHFIRHWTGWCQHGNWRTDVVLALIVGAIGIIGTYFVGQRQPEHRALDTLALALLVAGAASLIFRRQYPVHVLLFAEGITLLYLLLDYPKGPNFLTIIVAFFTAVMHGHRLIAWIVLTAEFVLFPWLPYLFGNQPVPTSTEIFALAGWLLVRATVTQIAQIRQERLTQIREEEAHRRAGEERLRIARELHDMLGHHISLISV